GKLTLPEHTLARLEQYGVSTEPFTRPAPMTRTISPGVPSRDTQPLPTRILSDATDTVVAHPATHPTLPTGPHTATGPLTGPITGRHTTPTLSVPVQPPTVLIPPVPAASRTESAPATRGGGKLLPILGLLVSLIAVAYVAREQAPESLRSAVPEGLRAKLWPGPVAELPAPAPSVPVAVEPAPVPPPPAPLPEPPKEDPKLVAEREAFDAAKSSDTLEGWKAFKKAFPDSALTATADIRIAALQPKPVPKPEITPPPPTERTTPAPVPSPVAPPVAETRPQPEPVPVPVPRAAPQTKTLSGGFRDCAGCPEMVKVPGGSLEMGDVAGTGEADEKPLRQLSIGAFYAGRYEVSFDDWAACVGGGGCSGTPRDAGWGRGQRPVINVSWNDAQRYVSWLTRESGKRYRLPSEAEFEYMMRAGSRSTYPWGEDGTQACTYANVADRQAKRQNPDWNTFPCDDGEPLTAPVGSYRANAFGLFDVAGNVWEWTMDCYQTYRQALADDSASNPANCARRVIRGGSWSDATRNLRSADRTASAPGATLKIVGFRVVRD
ncbi:MAG: SUMF1/EgtB/PvdO family nonheme iron enzyme, partial [Panacagrimonas sp.]